MSWTPRHLALAATLVLAGCFTDPGVATSAASASAAASDPSGGASTSTGNPGGESTGSESASTGASTGPSTSTTAPGTTTTTTTDPGTSAASLDPTTSTSTTGEGPTSAEICGLFCGVDAGCDGGSFDACMADCLAEIEQEVPGCMDRWASFAICVDDLTCTQYKSGIDCVPELNELVIVCEECQSKVVDSDWCEVTYECWDVFQIACDGEFCECRYNGDFLDKCQIDVPNLCALDDASILEIAAECCPWLAD